MTKLDGVRSMVPLYEILKGKQVKQTRKVTSDKKKKRENQNKYGIYDNNIESR